MLPEVRGEITESNPFARVLGSGRRVPESASGHDHLGRYPAGAGELLLERRREPQQSEGCVDRRLCRDRPSQARLVFAVAGPIANILLFAEPTGQCVGVVGIERRRAGETSDGLVQLSLALENVAEVVIDLGV